MRMCEAKRRQGFDPSRPHDPFPVTDGSGDPSRSRLSRAIHFLSGLPRLHSNPTQEEKEYYDDLSIELELADSSVPILYKLGEAFFYLPLRDARRQLKGDTKRYESEIEGLRGRVEECEKGMKELKVML